MPGLSVSPGLSYGIGLQFQRPIGGAGLILTNDLMPALALDFVSDFGPSMSRLTFTRASSASYFDSAGAMQIASTNVPRFDTNPVTLAARGLLIEEARTNLLLNSASLATQNCTVAATAYTLSFYGTGTVTLSGASTAGPLVGTGAFPQRVSLTFTPTAGTLTLTVTGTVEYANLEPGSFATSWIQTTEATATRAADVCSALTSSFAYNAAAGSIVSQQTLAATTADATARGIWALSDGTTANRIQEIRGGGSAVVAAEISVSGVAQLSSFNLTNAVVGTPNRTALAWQLDDVGGFGTGGTLRTDTSASIPSVTTLRIGAGSNGGNTLVGWIGSVAYYPVRLSNATLQALAA